MAFSCCKSNSHSIVESKHVEWMKNLPTDLHNEPITKLAIPGKKQSLIEMKISLNRYARFFRFLLITSTWT
jgi:hypothetical protein